MAALETEEEKKSREQSYITGICDSIFRLRNILFVTPAVCNAFARDSIAGPHWWAGGDVRNEREWRASGQPRQCSSVGHLTLRTGPIHCGFRSPRGSV
jgi:hypothetical protein